MMTMHGIHTPYGAPERDSGSTGLDLSIVVVSFNTRETTRTCLKKIQECDPALSWEVIVVDNASDDGSARMVEQEFPRARLIRLPANRGFAGGNNAGIREASGRYVLLLNSDAFIGPGVLESTIAFMDDHPEAGILGCRLTNPDGSMQASARMHPSPLNKLLVMTGLTARRPSSRFFGRVDFSWWDHAHPLEVGWVVGAYFLIRREVFDDTGPLDERYFLYFEEIDFCRAAQKAGWSVVFYPHAQVVHLGGQSAAQSGGRISAQGRQMVTQRIRSELRYYRKWHGLSWVILSALTEIVWRLLVFARNIQSRSESAVAKRREALSGACIMASILVRDRFGKGERA